MLIISCFILNFNILLYIYVEYKEKYSSTITNYRSLIWDINIFFYILSVCTIIFLTEDFDLDDFSELFLTTLSLIFLYSQGSINENWSDSEVWTIINFLLLSISLIDEIDDFLMLLLCLEMYTYSSYLLVSLKTKSLLSTEGGLKYLIIGSLSTGLFLFGFLFIYYEYGSIDFDTISELYTFNSIYILKNQPDYFFIIGWIFIIISLLIKIGSAPFHLWYIDAYQDLNYWLLGFLGIVSKFFLVMLLIDIIDEFHLMQLFPMTQLLFFCAFCSLIAGNLTILALYNIKRLLLYTAINGNAFILYCFSTGYENNLDSLIFYIFYFSLMYLNVILLFTCFKEWHYNTELINIYNFIQSFQTNAVLSWTLCLALLNLIAMPPFSFFWAKFLLLTVTGDYSIYFMYILLFVNVITVFVYIRFLNVIFFRKEMELLFLQPISFAKAFIISFLTMFNLFGCYGFNSLALYIIHYYITIH